jgi:hypothetical protein
MILFVITGALLIIISIILGWIIVAYRYLGVGFLKRIIRDDSKLGKCHMEYVIMALVLFAFYTLKIDLPFFLIVPACIGAFTNPSLLLVISVKPDIDTNVTSPFSLISTVSFLITTIGFGCTSLYIIYELLKSW